MTTTESTDAATIIRVEGVLWQPGSDFDAGIDHLATRFARASPLDADAVRAAGDFALQHAMLRDWAASANVDLDRELGRFLDEHLSMHVRPAPKITRRVRALAAAGPVHALTALGPRCGESVLRHAGCWRAITHLHANHAGAQAPDGQQRARMVSTLAQLEA
jgi:hypothetical protein